MHPVPSTYLVPFLRLDKLVEPAAQAQELNMGYKHMATFTALNEWA